MVNTVIRNGLIVDGSGGEPFAGDVLITNGVISEVGRLPEPENAVSIDAGGRCVTPGFIDIHRHADHAVFHSGFGAIELAQGITTAVTGACGLTPFPPAPEMAEIFAPVLGEKPFDIPSFEGYRDALAKWTLPVNIGGMIGSCSIRAAVKGFEDTPFTKPEMAKAKRIVDEAMACGALGVSLGIMYRPETYSTVEEMAETACGAARYGGFLTAHIRGEGDLLTQSVREAVQVAQKAGLPLEISHFKCCGAHNWGQGIYKAIEYIDIARKTHDITVDFYPYHGGSTTLLSLLPLDFPRSAWGDAGALRDALSRTYLRWDNHVLSLGFERVILNALSRPEHMGYNGKSVSQICAESGLDPYELISGILTGEKGRAGVIVMSMSPDDVDLVARLPYASVISDALYPADTKTAHPRLFSAFPKIIRDFVRRRGVLTLQEAVRKMTAMPAERLGIKKRGMLKPGYAADINIFTPENIEDRSDLIKSGLLAGGMDIVFVNGGLAWKNGRQAGSHGQWISRG